MRISDWSSDVCSSDLLTAANLCNRADAGKLGHLVHATNSFTALALPSAGCGPGAYRANCARAAACAILRTSPREPAPAVARTGAASASASLRTARHRHDREWMQHGKGETGTRRFYSPSSL